MRISMPRGDMREQAFSVKLNQEPFLDAFDEIYFTVKKTFKDINYLFQKRMTAGDIVSVGDGMFQFIILPEDTNELNFGDYVFDIELVISGRLKRTYVGTLSLTPESTYACNEGVRP